MAYIAPTTRTDGFIVTSSIWNQDVVNNVISMKEIAEIEPTIIYEELPAAGYGLTTTVWVTRHLSHTLRDPNSILYSTNYPSYQFSLDDGTYLVEITAHYILYNGTTWAFNRLRDVSNNATLTGLCSGRNSNGSSGSARASQIAYTYNEFILANGGPTTIELQTQTNGGGQVNGLADVSVYDSTNADRKGAMSAIIKLWKIA